MDNELKELLKEIIQEHDCVDMMVVRPGLRKFHGLVCPDESCLAIREVNEPHDKNCIFTRLREYLEMEE